MNTISLTANGSSISIYKPGYGYEVELHFPISSQVNGDGSRTYFISSGTPYPVLKPARWMLPPDQAAALAGFLRGPARGADIVFDFGHSGSDAINSGFFPAGPLFGDVSDYTNNPSGCFSARLLSQEPSAVLHAPLRWFSNDMGFIVTPKAQVTPSLIPQGKLDIDIGNGDESTAITGLPPPDSAGKPKPDYKLHTTYSRTGAASSVSGTPAADAFTATFDLTLRTANAAAIVAALITALEGASDYSDITFIIYDPGYGLFGADIGVAGTWKCQLLGSDDKAGDEIILKTKHISWDRWAISFAVLYRSTGT